MDGGVLVCLLSGWRAARPAAPYIAHAMFPAASMLAVGQSPAEARGAQNQLSHLYILLVHALSLSLSCRVPQPYLILSTLR